MATSKTQEATWEAKQTNGFFPLSLHCVALMASAYSNHGNQPQKRTLMRNSTLFVTEQQLPNVNGITFTTQAFVESKQQPSTTKVNEMTNSQCDHVNESLPTAAESNDNQEPITFTAAESKALIAMYVWGSHSITEAANIFWSDRNRMTQSEAEEHVINMVTGVNGYKYIGRTTSVGIGEYPSTSCLAKWKTLTSQRPSGETPTWSVKHCWHGNVLHACTLRDCARRRRVEQANFRDSPG
jgi:hypothetical protein